MKPINRIEDYMEGTNKKPEPAPGKESKRAEPIPATRARRGLHYTRPSAQCGHVQFAEKSSNHIAVCAVCGRKANVIVPTE